LGRADLAQPLAGDPAAAGRFFVVTAADGTLLKAAISTAEAMP
jgi:hypothetical protein